MPTTTEEASVAGPATRSDRGDFGYVVAIALALGLLNALRPAAVDDPAYLRQAAWWAAHPFDPLGGEAPLYQAMVPAARVASAPVGIGWLALGTAVAGDGGWALKAWLFPFALLLAWSLHRLLRLAAPEGARSWLAAIVLSPAILPSFGFMLEVPMLALAVASLAVFAEATPAAGRRAALAAGLLAGLALQTKYSAAPVLAALLAWGACARRPGAGLLAAATGVATFAAIEGLLLATTGASPALAYAAGRAARDPGGHAPLLTAWRLVTMAGTGAPVLIPLALTALGAPRAAVRLALAAVVLGFGCLALAPEALVRFLDAVTGARVVSFENVAVAWMGPVLVALAGVAAVRAWRSDPAAGAPPARALAAWLGAECALAPFVSASASVRRLLGAMVALALLLARLGASRLGREPARRAELAAGAAASVALGLLFWAADVDSALAERRALALALERIGAVRAAGDIAVVGDHWSAFQHEADRLRLRRVWRGRSRMESGDRLVVPWTVGGRSARLDTTRLALEDSVPFPQRGPLTTRRAFYDGRIALRRADPGAEGARVWRVTADGEVLLPRAGER